MPAKTKSGKKETKVTKTSKATKKSTKKVEEKKVQEPVVEKVEETSNKEQVEAENPDQLWMETFTKLIESQRNTLSNFRAEMNMVKDLNKIITKRVKILKKTKGKRKGGNQKKNPSGFNKPTHITKELATFLKVNEADLMPRTEVTKMLHKYIKEHNLQNPKDGREINCDKKLQSLLKIPKDVQLSYFNLQTYLSPHFKKAQN